MVALEKTLAEMTLAQLETFVREIVQDEIADEPTPLERPKRSRSYDEISASLDRHMIHPKPGTPSVVEMIREDRDR